MQISILILCVLGGYFLGSISAARVVPKIVSTGIILEEVDLIDDNTGSIFTMNTVGEMTGFVILGPRVGGIIGILYILKGVIAALIMRFVFPDQPNFLFVGSAVIIGHIWPLNYRFRADGGLSPGQGVLVVRDPVGTLILLLVAFFLGIFIINQVSFVVMGGHWLFIMWIAVRTSNWVYILFSVLINLILLIEVLPDIRIHLRAQKKGRQTYQLQRIPFQWGG